MNHPHMAACVGVFGEDLNFLNAEVFSNDDLVVSRLQAAISAREDFRPWWHDVGSTLLLGTLAEHCPNELNLPPDLIASLLSEAQEWSQPNKAVFLSAMAIPLMERMNAASVAAPPPYPGVPCMRQELAGDLDLSAPEDVAILILRIVGTALMIGAAAYTSVRALGGRDEEWERPVARLGLIVTRLLEGGARDVAGLLLRRISSWPPADVMMTVIRAQASGATA